MDRSLAALLFALIVAVTGLGVIVWRADEHARASSRELLCLQRAQTTATIGLLAPTARIDANGRVKAMQTLAAQIKAC